MNELLLAAKEVLAAKHLDQISEAYNRLSAAVAQVEATKAIDTARHDLPARYIDQAHKLCCTEWVK